MKCQIHWFIVTLTIEKQKIVFVPSIIHLLKSTRMMTGSSYCTKCTLAVVVTRQLHSWKESEEASLFKRSRFMVDRFNGLGLKRGQFWVDLRGYFLRYFQTYQYIFDNRVIPRNTITNTNAFLYLFIEGTFCLILVWNASKIGRRMTMSKFILSNGCCFCAINLCFISSLTHERSCVARSYLSIHIFNKMGLFWNYLDTSFKD